MATKAFQSIQFEDFSRNSKEPKDGFIFANNDVLKTTLWLIFLISMYRARSIIMRQETSLVYGAESLITIHFQNPRCLEEDCTRRRPLKRSTFTPS